MSKNKIINFKGNDYNVGVDWILHDGNKNIVRNKIKDTLKLKKYDGYGSKIDNDKKSIQIGYSNKDAKGTISLAKFLASKKEFSNSLVLLKFGDEFSDERYWMCAITKDGFIENGSDSLYSKDDFVTAVNSYVTLLNISDDYKIMIPDVDTYHMNEIVGDDLDGFKIMKFDADEALSGSTKGFTIDLVYSAKMETFRQITMLGLLGAVATSSYFFVYLENDLYHEIVGQKISSPYYDSKSAYTNFVKKQDKKLAKSYKNEAKKEILKEQIKTYSNKEVHQYISDLSEMFPLFLVEWELTDVSYKNLKNESGEYVENFSVFYSRISDSYGNTPQFKKYASNILKSNNINDYKFINTSKSVDKVEISLNFKDRPVFNIESENIQKNVKDNIKQLEKELKSYTNEIDAIESDTVELSFFDKRFGGELNNKKNEIESLISSIQRIYKEMKKERSKLELEDVFIEPEKISGRKVDVLSMMQSYSYYSWKSSNKSKFFPQPKKRLTRKNKETLNYYASSTNFEVSDASNIDIIGLDGLNTILTSEELLNKPYIKIQNVSLKIENEKWKIKGEYYEKL